MKVHLLREPKARLGGNSPFFHFRHDTTTAPVGAIRRGDWKLIESFEAGRTESYRLTENPGKTRNLAAVEPERVGHFRARLAAWRRDVGGRMPEGPAGPERP